MTARHHRRRQRTAAAPAARQNARTWTTPTLTCRSTARKLVSKIKSIDLSWSYKSLRAIVVKQCEIRPSLLLITKRKSHTAVYALSKKLKIINLGWPWHWQRVRSAILATTGFLIFTLIRFIFLVLVFFWFLVFCFVFFNMFHYLSLPVFCLLFFQCKSSIGHIMYHIEFEVIHCSCFVSRKTKVIVVVVARY